jgi:hypothetical protein
MDEQVDHSRRRLLTAATVGTGAVGLAFAAAPFLASWQPSERAKALGAPVDVDASKLEVGQMLKVVWRGQPVFVVRRGPATLDILGGHDDQLADPKSDDSTQPAYIKASGAARARNPDYWVGLAQREPDRRCRSGGQLARRLLLSLPWIAVRHFGPRVQGTTGAEEPDGPFVCDLDGCQDRDRRRRRCEECITKAREVGRDGRST